MARDMSGGSDLVERLQAATRGKQTREEKRLAEEFEEGMKALKEQRRAALTVQAATRGQAARKGVAEQKAVRARREVRLRRPAPRVSRGPHQVSRPRRSAPQR